MNRFRKSKYEYNMEVFSTFLFNPIMQKSGLFSRTNSPLGASYK